MQALCLFNRFWQAVLTLPAWPVMAAHTAGWPAFLAEFVNGYF